MKKFERPTENPYTPEELADKSRCISIVKYDGFILQFIRRIDHGEEAYLDICYVAVKRDGIALKFVDRTNMDNKSYVALCLLAVQQNGMVLELIDRSDFEDVDAYVSLCLKAVQQNGYAAGFIKYRDTDEDDRNNSKYMNVYMVAVQQNPFALQFVKKQTMDIVRAAVQSDGTSLRLVRTTDFTVDDYQKICLDAAHNDGYSLEYVNVDIVGDQYLTICYTAILQNPYAIQYVKGVLPSSETYRKLCTIAVNNNGFALTLITVTGSLNSDIFIAAVKQNGMVLKYIRRDRCLSDSIYYDICSAAINQNGNAIEFVEDKAGPTYDRLCLVAVQQDCFAIQYIENPTIESCRAAVQKNSKCLELIKNKSMVLLVQKNIDNRSVTVEEGMNYGNQFIVV